MKEEKQQKQKSNLKKSKKKSSYNYCIPSPMAKLMSMIDDRTQMEASLLSMFLLLIGMLLLMTYIVIYSQWSWWMRGMTIFNTLCGMLFMFSYLITTFQQYQQLRETQDIIGNFGTDEPFPLEPKQSIGLKEEKIKKSDLKELKGG